MVKYKRFHFKYLRNSNVSLLTRIACHQFPFSEPLIILTAASIELPGISRVRINNVLDALSLFFTPYQTKFDYQKIETNLIKGHEK